MRNASGENGFALMTVTVALAVLALIVGAVVVASQGFVRQGADALDAVRVDAALDAGVATVVSELARSSSIWNRPPQKIVVGEVALTVTIRPESSKVNLNVADPLVLTALLRTSGVPDPAAQALANEIADWRDPDTRPRPHGAEVADYLAAGRPPPADAPFADAAELARLLHGNADLADCVAPDVTVFFGPSAVDEPHASARVRRALRDIAAHENAAGGAAEPWTFISDSPTGLFEIHLTASTASGLVRTRRAVVRITGNPKDPFWVVQQGPAPDEQSSAMACRRFVAGTANRIAGER